jgi:PhnB protein
MSFHPYLNFPGTCREAFTRYHEIFGGDLVVLGMSDMPPEAGEVPAEHAGLVAHAALTIGDDLLMASDAAPEEHTGVQGMYVNVAVADVPEAERVFAALSEGGQVTMPLGEAFFSPRFGICVDRFGTPWMLTVQQAEGQGQ